MIYPDLSNTDYHADRRAINSSILDLLDCPAKYKAWKDNLIPNQETSAMMFGRAYHTCVMEPDKLESEFLIGDSDGRTKEGKANRAKAQELGLGVLSPSDQALLFSMRSALLQHPIASVFLMDDDRRIEHSIFWDHKTNWKPDWYDDTIECKGTVPCSHCEQPVECDGFSIVSGEKIQCPSCEEMFMPIGVFCKTRPDLYTADYVVDFKTYTPQDGDSDTPKDFLWKKIKKGYKYNRQAAFQLAGLNAEGITPRYYYWVVQEKVPPFVTCVLKADLHADVYHGAVLSEGAMLFTWGLNRIKPCIASGDYYAYPDIIDIQDILER